MYRRMDLRSPLVVRTRPVDIRPGLIHEETEGSFPDVLQTEFHVTRVIAVYNRPSLSPLWPFAERRRIMALATAPVGDPVDFSSPTGREKGETGRGGGGGDPRRHSLSIPACAVLRMKSADVPLSAVQVQSLHFAVTFAMTNPTDVETLNLPPHLRPPRLTFPLLVPVSNMTGPVLAFSRWQFYYKDCRVPAFRAIEGLLLWGYAVVTARFVGVERLKGQREAALGGLGLMALSALVALLCMSPCASWVEGLSIGVSHSLVVALSVVILCGSWSQTQDGTGVMQFAAGREEAGKQGAEGEVGLGGLR
uniref:Uncharacterized protein n=1 Tax=Chromera velia CCMP2878 TaxID=1169474 RepID=A0A0G4H7F1_9ALVE|eukprot:Cvel_24970.t1-p1 / transcript=Cvel_24970.t1 / gene=Cvel_24970 / organism=Chromera_velia_CCMP2878 / gene_product=hypothetical protein / transcript_product=hypothetical protein / location=Cvel_scaffold2765:21375-23158(+) / protein_length=306 / sequence_SO=supercontig / SO=protein_coding / is_pseudo=false